jgi:hypothetical protein
MGKIKTLLLLISMAFVASNSFAQYDSTKILQPVNGYGFEWKNGKFKGPLGLFNDTVKLAVKDSNFVAFKNGTLFRFTGYYWAAMGGGGGGSQTWQNTLDEPDGYKLQHSNFMEGQNNKISWDNFSEFLVNPTLFRIRSLLNPSDVIVSDLGIQLNAYNGNLFADSLLSSNNAEDSMVVWNSATGQFGARVIPIPLDSNDLKTIFWALRGNTGTDPSRDYVGTGDSQPLVLKTNASEMARFSGDGSHGISLQGASIPGGNYNLVGGSGSSAGNTSENYAFAYGLNTVAGAEASVSMGKGNSINTDGNYSALFGDSNISSAPYSFGAGQSNNNTGHYSQAFGLNNLSKSYGGFVLGTYADGTAATSSSTYNSLNRVFQVGIGTGTGARANSLTGLFNGNWGFGVLVPTARIHITAATATAGTGQLKFENSTLPTTPEFGLMNMKNGLWFLDSSNSIRDTIATRSWARNNISGGGGGGGYTNLTQFIAQNNWKLFHSNGSGAVVELGFGTNGQYFRSNGTTSAPSWETATLHTISTSGNATTNNIFLTNSAVLQFQDPGGNSFNIRPETTTGYPKIYVGNNGFFYTLNSGSLTADRSYTWQNASGTIALTSDIGIKTLNGLSGATQTFATGTTGSDFNIVSSGTAHTFHFPSSSASNRGLLTSTDWSTFNSKENALTFSTGLTRATNTITNNLSTGVAGGQSAIGGTASGNNLTLSSTSHATKGKILFGTSAYDETANYLNVNTTTNLSGYALNVNGNIHTNSIIYAENNIVGGAKFAMEPLTGSYTSFANADPSTGIWELGDVGGDVNGTKLTLNDATSVSSLNANSFTAKGSAYPSGLFKVDNVNGKVLIGDFGGSGNAYQFIYDDVVGKIHFQNAGGTHFKIDVVNNLASIGHSGMKLGINKATGTEAIDVVGNIRFSGALMPNNTAGTSGQVLTSAGAGVVPTWQTPVTGSGTVISGNQYRLGYYATTGTVISEAAAITANRALISDANGVPTHSATTATELGYVSGVTSLIQTQLNNKTLQVVTNAGSSTTNTIEIVGNNLQISDGILDYSIFGTQTGTGYPTFRTSTNANNFIFNNQFLSADRTYSVPDVSGTLPVGTGTANLLTYWSGTNTLSSLNTGTYPSLTELSYVKGVTSSLQTQLNAKQTTTLTDGNFLVGNGSNVATSVTPTGDVTFTNAGVFSIGTNKVVTGNILNSSITLAKIANIADQTILGNNTGGSAAPVALTAGQTKTLLSLNNVENTALSTWAGSSNINTLGTITTGTWNGTAIANANLANSTISGISLGSNLNNLNISAELISGGASSYNGSAAKSIAIQAGSVTNSMLANSAVANLSGTNTGDQNLFSSIPVSGQTTVTANSATTALTLIAGSNMTITTNNTTKEITFASSGGGSGITFAQASALMVIRY